MIKIKHYPNMEPARQAAFKKLSDLKRNKDYENALTLLDYMQDNLYDIYHQFSPMIKLNEQRAIIYKKKGDISKSIYYRVLSEIGGLLNTVFIEQTHMLSDCYYTERFINHFEDKTISEAVKKYIEWFKPVAKEMTIALSEVKYEYDQSYLNYEYKALRDLEIFLLKTNDRLNKVLKLIDENPFKNYYYFE